jgi:hypothetical protein
LKAYFFVSEGTETIVLCPILLYFGLAWSVCSANNNKRVVESIFVASPTLSQ